MTVEAVLWLPLLFGVLMLVADVSMAVYGKAQAFRLIQDTNRALSVHRISTAWEVKRFVEGSMRTWAPNATARVCLSNDGIVYARHGVGSPSRSSHLNLDGSSVPDRPVER